MVAPTTSDEDPETVPSSPIESLLSRQLGVRIAQVRHQRGMSQEALAQRIGMSTNHIQLMESGLSDRKKQTPANPRLNTLIALSEALDVPLPELLAGITAPPSD